MRFKVGDIVRTAKGYIHKNPSYNNLGLDGVNGKVIKKDGDYTIEWDTGLTKWGYGDECLRMVKRAENE